MNTREKLLVAARQCLAESGHRACTIKKIAARAGVNHGLVYHYFGTKEELFLEVIRREGEDLRRGVSLSGHRIVEDFIMPKMFRNPERLRLMLEFFSLAKDVPRVARELREVLVLDRQLLTEVLGLEDPLTPTLLMGAYFGMALQYMVDNSLPVEQAAQRLLAMVAAGTADPARG